jgi:DNA-binding transcriptional LysR family regulator
MNFANFDLNLLRVLDALLDTRSTTYAGQRIGLSQPAVSAALGRLRKHLNDPLFVRYGPRLVPTDYALTLAGPVHSLLEQAELTLAGAPRFDPTSAEEIFRLSGSDFFAEMLLPTLAQELADYAPGLRVQLVDLVPDNYVAKLDSNDVDLALIPQLDGPSWMEWQPLFHSSFVMIARRGHPVLAEEIEAGQMKIDTLCALEHILFSPEGRLEAMSDTALARIGRKRRVVMTMPVMAGICSTVAETDYIALVPQQFAHRMRQKLPLELLLPPPELPAPVPLIGMVWHRRRNNSPAHRWLRETVARLMEPLNEGETELEG